MHQPKGPKPSDQPKFHPYDTSFSLSSKGNHLLAERRIKCISAKDKRGLTANRTRDLAQSQEQELQGCRTRRANYTTKPSGLDEEEFQIERFMNLANFAAGLTLTIDTYHAPIGILSFASKIISHSRSGSFIRFLSS